MSDMYYIVTRRQLAGHGYKRGTGRKTAETVMHDLRARFPSIEYVVIKGREVGCDRLTFVIEEE